MTKQLMEKITGKAFDVQCSYIAFEQGIITESELTELRRVFVDLWVEEQSRNFQYWIKKPITEKITQLVAVIRSIRTGDNLYEKLYEDIGYPYGPTGCSSEMPDTCLRRGCVRTQSGNEVAWFIWERSHTISFSFS
jgi:hypothetical protein